LNLAYSDITAAYAKRVKVTPDSKA